MKRILILSAVALISHMLVAQNPAISSKYSDKEIETLVENYQKTHHRNVGVNNDLLQKFQQDFPKAHFVEWETNDEIYEVEFEIKFRDYKALYDKGGNLLMYKQEIHRDELPAIVKTAAEAKYPKYEIEDIEKIIKGTKSFYKIEVELNGAEVTIVVTGDGKFISEKIDY